MADMPESLRGGALGSTVTRRKRKEAAILKGLQQLWEAIQEEAKEEAEEEDTEEEDQDEAQEEQMETARQGELLANLPEIVKKAAAGKVSDMAG